MKIIDLKLVFTTLLFIIVFISGIMLSKYGRPLNVVIFTIHKVISLLALIPVIIVIYKLLRGVDIKALDYSIILVTSIFFISAIITGGLLSIEKMTNNLILISHKVLSLLTLISIAVTFYFFIILKV
jgi:hypothetical protein